MERVGFDGLDVAGAERDPLAIDGELGLAFEAVDSDRPGSGMRGEFATLSKVEQQHLPAGAGGDNAARLALRSCKFLSERNQVGHGIILYLFGTVGVVVAQPNWLAQ